MFQSFLNQNAELQIGDTIYQYTDHGLFMVQVDKYQKLIDYKASKQDVHDLGDVNNLTNKDPCNIGIYLENTAGGKKEVVTGVVHFMAKLAYPCDVLIEEEDDYGNGNNNSGNTTPQYDMTYAEIAQISNSLESCSGEEPFLPNLFGTVKVCVDEYVEDEYRVKTKYWDVDFGLGFSIGVKVKHQKKSWVGYWYKSDADKIALGINSISWKFDMPSYTPPQNPNHVRVYANNSAWEILRDQNYDYSLGSTSVPNLPFYYSVDAVIEMETFLGDISVSSPLPDEEQIRTVFYGGIFNKVKELMQRERGIELKK